MPLRALLADENLAVQKLVELTLTKEGIEVITTDNGLSALDIAIKNPPDIILVDFKLEGLDIFSFIQKTKKRERLSDIPIIVLVDSTETYDPVYFQSLGVDAFFKKPIDTEELIEGIKKLSPIPGPSANKTENPDEAGAADLSKHFSSSEDDSETISKLLGWSSPTDSLQENDPGQKEPTIVSSSSPQDSLQDQQEENPFSQSEPITETDSMEEPTILMAADTGEDSQDPFSQTKQGAETDATEELTVLMTPTSDDDSLGSGEGIDLLQPSPFEDQVEVSEQKEDPFSLSEETSSEDSFHPPIEDNPFSGTELKDTDLEDKPLNRTTIDEADKNTVQASTEKIVKEMLPDLVKSSLSSEMIATIVEGVVWEVVAPLAEAEIKKAIKRLQSEEA